MRAALIASFPARKTIQFTSTFFALSLVPVDLSAVVTIALPPKDDPRERHTKKARNRFPAFLDRRQDVRGVILRRVLSSRLGDISAGEDVAKDARGSVRFEVDRRRNSRYEV